MTDSTIAVIWFRKKCPHSKIQNVNYKIQNPISKINIQNLNNNEQHDENPNVVVAIEEEITKDLQRQNEINEDPEDVFGFGFSLDEA